MSKVKKQLRGLLIFDMTVSSVCSIFVTAMFVIGCVFFNNMLAGSVTIVDNYLLDALSLFVKCFVAMAITVFVAYGQCIYRYNKDSGMWDKVHRVKTVRDKDFEISYIFVPDIKKDVMLLEKIGTGARK